MNIFKIYLLCIPYLLVLHSDSFEVQEHSTKKAKVVLVFNEKTGVISNLQLYRSFQKMDMKSAMSSYPNSKFYIGTLTGNYHLNDDELIPSQGATITVYTQREYIWNESAAWSENYNTGDSFSIGNKQARVLMSKKGELILKAQ